jgi:ubiquinone/menaquinone biosynthesis C-methylase UbiE
MTQYDNIATQYDNSAEDRSDRENVLVPSAKHYLGKLQGKSVLDLACGSGYFTRLIKDLIYLRK